MSVAICPPPGSTGWDALGYDMNSTMAGATVQHRYYPVPSASGFNDQYRTGFVYGDSNHQCVRWLFMEPVSFAGGQHVGRVTRVRIGQRIAPAIYNAASRPVAIDNSGHGVQRRRQHLGVDRHQPLQRDGDHDGRADYTFPKGGYLCGTTGKPCRAAAITQIYAGKYQPFAAERKAAAEKADRGSGHGAARGLRHRSDGCHHPGRAARRS